MAKYIDISDWNEKPWFGTKGTRNKIVVENPSTGIYYYFKTSLLKINKDYKHEFWSEILASEIGRFLDYNILEYNIAFHKKEIGCISEFMNTEGESELTEGIQYLTGYNTAYKPDTKESRDKSHPYFHRTLLKLVAWLLKNLPNFSNRLRIKFHSLMPNKFAPIYDSGSCLGRELLDEKVQQMLSDEFQLKVYIKRGTSEIHWMGNKISHFELIRNISKQYPDEIKSEINRIKTIYKESEISRIVNEIDRQLPSDKMHFNLPDKRKKLIIKMVSLRYNELIKVLN